MGFLNGASSLSSIVQTLIGLINMLISVLAALALVVFFIGLVRYIKDSSDSHAHTEGRERIIWSLVALFILFSIWGILALMSITFFGSSQLNGGSTQTGQYPVDPSFQGVGAQPY
jgi:hypothetical protein